MNVTIEKEKKFLFQPHKSGGGFTLVELMVTVTIITLMMSVVLWSYGGFNDRLALSGASQEIVLAVRQAQTYSLDVRENKTGGGNFNAAYGIYFDSNDDSVNKDYYVFIDLDKDKEYSNPLDVNCSAVGTECIEKFSIPNGVKISSVNSTSGCPPAVKLDITFRRPSPDAIINFENNGGNVLPACANSLDARIVLTSPKGATLTVVVDRTGQIGFQ